MGEEIERDLLITGRLLSSSIVCPVRNGYYLVTSSLPSCILYRVGLRCRPYYYLIDDNLTIPLFAGVVMTVRWPELMAGPIAEEDKTDRGTRQDHNIIVGLSVYSFRRQAPNLCSISPSILI